MKTNPLVSRHGLTLQWAEDDRLVFDGSAMYVDDLLDCFEQWDGQGSLKEYCLRCFGNEVTIAERLPAHHRELRDSILTLRQQLLRLLHGESSEGLCAARAEFLKHPEQTRDQMLASARRGERPSEWKL